MDPAQAADYTEFLAAHFYPADLCIKLRLDSALCADLLRSKQWVGVELRETGGGNIIGCVVSKAAGYMRLADLKQAPTGIVDYLCVDPRWRGRGLVYVLLRSLYAYCVESDGRYIQFFKKEGGFGLLPPVAHEVYVGRIGARANTGAKKKLDRLTWFNFLETQKMDGGQGQLALINHNPNYETELYTTSYNETTVIYKPTHEYGENETAGRAIVVAWPFHSYKHDDPVNTSVRNSHNMRVTYDAPFLPPCLYSQYRS
jgi:GNAT superfamily N-acetyltransferase